MSADQYRIQPGQYKPDFSFLNRIGQNVGDTLQQVPGWIEEHEKEMQSREFKKTTYKKMHKWLDGLSKDPKLSAQMKKKLGTESDEELRKALKKRVPSPAGFVDPQSYEKAVLRKTIKPTWQDLNTIIQENKEDPQVLDRVYSSIGEMETVNAEYAQQKQAPLAKRLASLQRQKQVSSILQKPRENKEDWNEAVRQLTQMGEKDLASVLLKEGETKPSEVMRKGLAMLQQNASSEPNSEDLLQSTMAGLEAEGLSPNGDEIQRLSRIAKDLRLGEYKQRSLGAKEKEAKAALIESGETKVDSEAITEKASRRYSEIAENLDEKVSDINQQIKDLNAAKEAGFITSEKKADLNDKIKDKEEKKKELKKQRDTIESYKDESQLEDMATELNNINKDAEILAKRVKEGDPDAQNTTLSQLFSKHWEDLAGQFTNPQARKVMEQIWQQQALSQPGVRDFINQKRITRDPDAQPSQPPPEPSGQTPPPSGDTGDNKLKQDIENWLDN